MITNQSLFLDMQLTEGHLYHIFNRGNNREKIFFRPENYLYFLKGIGRYIKPTCDILAWCLMPNHFHMLIHANNNSVAVVKDRSFERQAFSEGIKMLLSSYTKAINKQEGRTGSLFQQKTKSVSASDFGHDARTVFHYIHQNPVKARLVSKMEDWRYSSLNDYLDDSLDSLCNKDLAMKLIDFNLDTLYKESYEVINFRIED